MRSLKRCMFSVSRVNRSENCLCCRWSLEQSPSQSKCNLWCEINVQQCDCWHCHSRRSYIGRLAVLTLDLIFRERLKKQPNKEIGKQKSKNKTKNYSEKLISYMLTLRRILTSFWYLLQLKMPEYVARAFQCVIVAAKIWLQGWFIITSPQLDWWTFAPVKSGSKVTGTSCVGHIVTKWSIPTPQIQSPFWAFACCYTEKQTLI